MRTLTFTLGIGVSLALASPLWAQPQVAGFTQDPTPFASGVGSITDIAWTSDGTNQYLFFIQQGGAIRVVRNGALQAGNVTSVTPIVSGGELGLLGLAIDPSFNTNRFIYIFVTETTSVQRIYRYTTTDSGGPTGTVGVTGSRMKLGPDLPTMNVNHNGGALGFGSDGNLYFGIGNNGNGNNVGGNTLPPPDTTPNPNEMTTMGSKVGRMTKLGAALTSNPFYTGAGGDRDFMWSRGWRNPFGIAFQPGTADPWILEVGDAWEHIFIASSGSNRGWNTENNSSTTNGKLIPRFAYQRITPASGTSWRDNAGCITRGCFYTGSSFPAGYTGNLFFAELNAGRLIRLIPNGTGLIPAGNASSFVDNIPGIVDVEMGPDGALYYASRGNSAIYRLQYTNTTTQNIIVSTNSLTVTEGSTNTFTVRLATTPAATVTVNIGRSSGDTDVTASPPSLTFTSTAPQTVTVSAATDADAINDGATIRASSTGLANQDVTITVTDTGGAVGAPSANITQPLNGAVVSGMNAEFYGAGSDPQGITTLDRAEFRVDGVLVYTDNTVMVAPGDHYHLGGGHGMWNTFALSNGSHTLTMTVFDAGGLSGSQQVTVTVDNPEIVAGCGATGLELILVLGVAALMRRRRR